VAVLLLLVVNAAICGYLAGKLADLKGSDGSVWVVLGALFGPLGLIAAAGLPDLRSQRALQQLVDRPKG